MVNSLSLILRDPDTDLVDVEERLGAAGVDVLYEDVVTDEPGLRVDEWTCAADEAVRLQLVRDARAGCAYLSVVTDDELREAVRRDGARDPAAYLRLGLGLSTAFDEPSLELILDGLRADDPAVRAQAASAAALLAWPELRDPARAALETEQDPAVARLLAAVTTLTDAAG